jgi:hypothetical protein
MLRALIQKEKYDPELVFQVDETSCLVKSVRRGKRVVPSTLKLVPLKKIPPILHTTILFSITGTGRHLTPQILFSEDTDLSGIERWRFPDIQIRKTRSGWMTKECFEVIMKETIMKEVARVRSETGDSTKKALLILDGHSSRNNRQLWELFAANGIDVVVLPAHTSHILQPLDLGPNAAFKRTLEKSPPFLKKRELQTKIGDFIRSLCDAFYSAMTPSIIRHSFNQAGIFSASIEHVLGRCLETLPSSIPPPKATNRFTLGGKLITTSEFLKEWSDFEVESQKRKEGKGKAKGEKGRAKAEKGKSIHSQEKEETQEEVDVEEGEEQIFLLNVKDEEGDGKGDEGGEGREGEEDGGEGVEGEEGGTEDEGESDYTSNLEEQEERRRGRIHASTAAHLPPAARDLAPSGALEVEAAPPHPRKRRATSTFPPAHFSLPLLADSSIIPTSQESLEWGKEVRGSETLKARLSTTIGREFLPCRVRCPSQWYNSDELWRQGAKKLS